MGIDRKTSVEQLTTQWKDAHETTFDGQVSGLKIAECRFERPRRYGRPNRAQGRRDSREDRPMKRRRRREREEVESSQSEEKMLIR